VATTTTTQPTSFSPQSGATATTATYVPPTASYTLNLTAGTSPCWVSVLSSATGKSLFTGTLPAGQSQQVPAQGTTTVTIGAPSALAVTLDGEPVTMPPGFQAPFTMTMQPAVTPGTTVTTSGTTAPTGSTTTSQGQPATP
jgi:hypothetical protein